jgi:predicted amidophosphoribosyltransferase
VAAEAACCEGPQGLEPRAQWKRGLPVAQRHKRCGRCAAATLKLYGRMKMSAMPGPITRMIHSSKFLGLPWSKH